MPTQGPAGGAPRQDTWAQSLRNDPGQCNYGTRLNPGRNDSSWRCQKWESRRQRYEEGDGSNFERSILRHALEVEQEKMALQCELTELELKSMNLLQELQKKKQLDSEGNPKAVLLGEPLRANELQSALLEDLDEIDEISQDLWAREKRSGFRGKDFEDSEYVYAASSALGSSQCPEPYPLRKSELVERNQLLEAEVRYLRSARGQAAKRLQRSFFEPDGPSSSDVAGLIQ